MRSDIEIKAVTVLKPTFLYKVEFSVDWAKVNIILEYHTDALALKELLTKAKDIKVSYTGS